MKHIAAAALAFTLTLSATTVASAQCPGDVIPSGNVDGVDLSAVLGAWGSDGSGAYSTDVNGNGLVEGGDLAIILGAWGACPPVVSSVLPNVGTIAGGTPITISGNYFLGTTSVTIGGLAATGVQIVSATTINAITPAGAAGSAAVSVTANGRTGSLAGGYSYTSVSVPSWATLIEPDPNPSIVTSGVLRQAITTTGFAWRVKDTATQIEFVLIPPGTFNMGCSASDLAPCRANESPIHQVTLTNAFYMGRYEVMQAQWQARMGNNPSYFSGTNNPVEMVSWNGIQGFLSQTGMRLPTEAEWEYAYRAGTTTAFHGYTGQESGTNNDYQYGNIAWIYSTGGCPTYWTCQTHPVGLKAGNGLGLHDMSGNVAELVSDWFDTYTAAPQTNPTGPLASPQNTKVYRGGFYGSTTNPVVLYGRSSERSTVMTDSGSQAVGFRVVRTP